MKMTLMDSGVVGRAGEKPGTEESRWGPRATVKVRHNDELRADTRQSDMALMTMIMVLMAMVVGTFR